MLKKLNQYKINTTFDWIQKNLMYYKAILLEETLVFVQIIFIDVVMAADNAIIIGLIAANFAP